MKKGLCMLAGALMAAAVLLISVLAPALSVPRFEQALVKTVNMQALGISQSDLSAFAAETMGYLRGEKDAWQPHIPHTGVPEAFSIHMAEVKAAVQAAPWVIALMLAAGVALLWLGGWQRRRALLGVLVLMAVIALVLVWAMADFHSFWMVLHKVFIRGGIFPYGEPIMQLFPLNLFFQYIAPVCLWAVGLLVALCIVLTVEKKS